MTSKGAKTEEQGSKTQLERVLAALAHGSILLWGPLNVVGGIIEGQQWLTYIGIIGIGVALCIWLVMKGKSDYARGQALQAVVYQVFVVVGTRAVTLLLGFAIYLLYLQFQIDFGIPFSWAQATLFALPIGFQVLAILYALWGAVRCLGGHDFRYAVVGKLVGSGSDALDR